MLIMSNRCVNPAAIDETAFGETPNEKGPNEIRLAHATKQGKKWRVEIVAEPAKLNKERLPSKVEYLKLRDKCASSGRHAVFYIHGFNKTFPESLEQGHDIEQRYGVEVVLFSWPSSPGGLAWNEYRKARRIAQASFGALDSALEKLGHYAIEAPFDRDALTGCHITFNFMGYSLGNYLFQNYVVSNDYAAETRIFSNVILCQADVDSKGHGDWVGKIVAGQRVYATINENDKVLGWSESVNYARLGKTLGNLTAPNAIYVDVTRGKGVGNEHQVWGNAIRNAAVKAFFHSAFRGGRGEEEKGFIFDARLNAFRL
jgi:hypothetical protein